MGFGSELAFGGYAGVGCVVVIAVVDAFGGAILLAGQGVAILRGEVTVIGRAHGVFFGRDARLVGLSVSGTPGSDLAVANAVADAGLLIGLAGVDGVTLFVGRLLSDGSKRQRE